MGTDDHYSGSGHGTLVAGIAGYGDLQQSLLSQSTIELNHKLCSVKILPRNGSNEENLYGDVTKQAVSIAEIASPTNTLIFAMTVTAKINLVEEGLQLGLAQLMKSLMEKE